MTFPEYPRCPPLLDGIQNGRSSSENRTYSTGEIIEFTCNPGYRTTTQSWITCATRETRDGYASEWFGVTPRCEGWYGYMHT